MRRSPDYYNNRRLLRQLKEDKRYRPTVTATRKWFDILNEQIFDGKLPYINLYVRRLDSINVHAYFNYCTKTEKKKSDSYEEPSIEMASSFPTERIFVEILAHEMVHYFQYLNDEPLGHGPTFMAWRDNFSIKGITLHKVA